MTVGIGRIVLSVELLPSGRMDACHAINEAMRAVARMSPHGRDYQTVEPEIYRAAVIQNDERLSKLAALYLEIEAEASRLSAEES